MAITKHVNYFALQKACEKPGCPLCTLINERITRYIDGMLFEHISDRTFRAQYREAGGFCLDHSKILLSYRDGLAVAILGMGTLDDYLLDFKKKKMRKFKQICPACAEKQRIEKEFLTFIAESHKEDAASDEEMRKFITQSDGLCVPHYALMVKLTKVPKWISSFQEEKFTALRERTARFIDYSAWGKQEQFASLPDKDKIVWKEIADALRGQVE